MLVCILAMCTVGSYAAWLAGNVVLGSFTLFLTFCIGIRFLIKPDTSKRDAAKKGARLDLRGVIVSLFFGLTIGFGTGFVGTGGGMMMLVVFTMFLGMELKTAVGTSTFIMTFTALIASASHIAIHPAIVLQRWDVLLICMVVATLASLVSARFANRVNSRTVGLVTGAVLTVLGAAMLLLYFWDTLARYSVIVDTLSCLKRFVLYIIPCVLVLLLIKTSTKIPKHVFRKLLHLVAFTCIIIMLLGAEQWQSASVASLLIAAVIYPILALLENESWFSRLFVEKRHGEIKQSLVLLFSMFAVLSAIGWGVFGKPELTAAAILMWGVGDAAAALVGIPFGKHKVRLKLADGKKSWEGTISMGIVSFAFGMSFLLAYAQTNLFAALIMCLCGAVAGALVELFSPSEWDTVSVPAAILAVLLLF